MSKYLVIVESPAKARTISAILGKDYDVTSSMGHIADLPAKQLGVDVDKDFAPKYRTIAGKEKIVKQLREKAKNKEIVYLATDPDREGEAISWHIREKLTAENKNFKRVSFHEITEEAIKDAFSRGTDIDSNKVNAQTARRVLDRLVGYFLSPLLWKKVVRGLSAGRVQSVALKFIVEREREIEKFVPKTTYSVEATFKHGQDEFEAGLEKYHGKKGVFDDESAAADCIGKIKQGPFTIVSLIKKESRRKGPPPFTTSLLQQDAFNKLKFSSQKTMMVAQRLYEGVDIQGASVGLITYMRTDSFQIAPKAKAEARAYIETNIGREFIPDKDHVHKEKKGAQLAHEAIRPTSVSRTPSEVRQYLNDDEAALYQLIWKRFLASCMKEATFENTKVLIAGPHAEFGASGTRLVFEGFLKVLGRDEEANALPAMKASDPVTLEGIESLGHTTKPPPRFNDASLVKLLEEKGIGRPSTYAPTIYTLVKRNYARKEKGGFIPTELGIKVNDLLVEHFKNIVDDDFTARMESNLDLVEDGKVEWHKLLADFFPAFRAQVEKAGSLITKDVEKSDKVCPKCGAPMVIKWSRRGKFLSCSTFPACRYAESITSGVACPGCKAGQLIQRRNKRGQLFYGCSKYPACTYTSRTLEAEAQDNIENPKP